tara:strand:+ start:146 stop:853 length:708 start_codon:yes stop_codon:yes gene_type:complete
MVSKNTNKKIGLVLLCRMGSNRMPGKTMMKINNISVLQRVLNRCKRLGNFPIVIATSKDKNDDIISEYCMNNNLNIFRGSEKNVAKRFLDCCKFFKFENAARINCDRVLLDLKILKDVLQLHLKEKSDLTSNFRSVNLIKGQGCEVIKITALENFISEFDSFDREHVTNWFYKNPEKIKLIDFKMKNYGYQLDMSLDTYEDLDRIKKWISLLKDNIDDSSIEQIIKLNSTLLYKG